LHDAVPAAEFDPAGELCWVSPALEALLHLPPGARTLFAQGSNPTPDTLTPAGFPDGAHPVARRDHDGTLRWFREQWAPADGGGAFGVFTDVTEAHTGCLELEARLDAVNRVQGIVEYDAQGRVCSVNDVFLRLFGYTEAEVLGQTAALFVDASAARDQSFTELWARLARGEAVSGRYQRRAKGGAVLWLMLSYAPVLDEAGHPLRVVNVLVDVTREVEEEQRLGRTLTEVKTASDALRDAAQSLALISTTVSSASTETSTQAAVVTEAAGQISGNVSSVAAAAEELSSTVRDIAANAASAATRSRAAKDKADQAGPIIEDLTRASDDIGRFTRIISTIAQQTNLLALNATIEAARAGDMGKGFAVVANEVKALARETSRATEEIGRHIEAVKSGTERTVRFVHDISGEMEQLDVVSNSIATAVEEQAATTRDIARNASEVSRAVGNVVSNIEGVSEAARLSAEGASKTEVSARQLSELSVSLEATLERKA
jgi:methyl-accepting chemotaxis protein